MCGTSFEANWTVLFPIICSVVFGFRKFHTWTDFPPRLGSKISRRFPWPYIEARVAPPSTQYNHTRGGIAGNTLDNTHIVPKILKSEHAPNVLRVRGCATNFPCAMWGEISTRKFFFDPVRQRKKNIIRRLRVGALCVVVVRYDCT